MSDLFIKLKDFFENRDVAKKATNPLSKKAEGEVVFSIDKTKSYSFRRVDGESYSSIFENSPKEPDFTITLSEGALNELISLKSESVGDFGVLFFKLLKNKESGKEVSLKIHIGFIKMISKGYLKVLLLGGPVVMSALTKLGVHGIDGIKKIFSKKKDS
ncbi:hypothetical protein JXR93_07205 [bacterium]|nr:hypothetical protein [bacterium]